MSSFSPALEYFCQRLEGLSTGIFRLESQNQSSGIQAQSILRFTLPSNALVDMHSFGFHFNAQTSTGAGTSGTVADRLPNKIESLINRVEVSIGGVAVSSGSNFYNVLTQTKAVVDGTHNDDAGMNHPEIITTGALNNYVNGISLTTDEVYPTTGNAAQFCIDKWNGFIGECEPRVLDTSLLGDVVITLYLEQANLCLTRSDDINAAGFITSAALGGAPQLAYTLNNVYASVRCYSLASGLYDNMIAEQMNKAGSLEVGFKQYFSFRDNNTGSSRFTVATQSLDRILVAHHQVVNPAGATQHPVLVSGYNAIGGTAADRCLGFGKVNYIHPYSSFNTPTAVAGSVLEFEWQLNGAKYPQFRAKPEDVYRIMRLSSHNDHRVDWEYGRHAYLANRFVSAIKLTLDAPNSRYIQGLDTRSVSLNGYYNIYNMGGSKNITMFCECTSSLLISAGRQIELVQ